MPLVAAGNFSFNNLVLASDNFISLISGTLSGTNTFSNTCVAFDISGSLHASATYNNIRNSVSYTYQTLAAFKTDGTVIYKMGYGHTIYPDVSGIAVSNHVYMVGSGNVNGTSSPIVGQSSKTTGSNVGFTRTKAGQATAGTSIAVDSTENVYTAGWTLSGSMLCTLMKQSNFSTGAIAWQRQVTGLEHRVATKLAIDKSDNVYLLGCAKVSTIFRPAFLKLSSAGTIIGQKIITLGATTMNSFDIACDSVGNTIILAVSTPTALVIKLDPSGNIIWQKTCPPTSMYFRAVAMDSSDNVYIAGQNATTETIILKLDSAGNKLWCNKLANTQTNTAYSIAVDNKGNFAIGGIVGATNALIAKLPDDGSKLGTYGIFTYSTNAITISDGTATIADTTAFSLAPMTHTTWTYPGVGQPGYVAESTHLAV